MLDEEIGIDESFNVEFVFVMDELILQTHVLVGAIEGTVGCHLHLLPSIVLSVFINKITHPKPLLLYSICYRQYHQYHYYYLNYFINSDLILKFSLILYYFIVLFVH